MEPTKYEIDDLDRGILTFLQRDARMPFLEMARKLRVSGGTIHQRVEKMKTAGVITGSKIGLDYEKLGFGVPVFLGVHLSNAKSLPKVLKQLEKLDEVVEVYYTSGNYAFILKAHTRTIKDYYRFLSEKLQAIDGIQYTESFICLHQPLQRDIRL